MNVSGFDVRLEYYSVDPGMGGCPGRMLGSRSRAANPHDRDRDSKPRDSRDWDKNLRDSPATKIQRDYKSRHFGTKIPLSPGTVPLSRDSTGRKSLFRHFLCPVGPGPGQIFAKLSCMVIPQDKRDRDKKSRDCPVPSLAHP